MNPLTLSKIAQFAGASLSSGDETVMIDKVGTDSRTIKPGELFVALRGENFDGHDFVEAAAKSGATGALVDQNWNGHVPENFALIRASETLHAYQQIAANYRRSLGLKVVAITGSNGKTSTKDFAASVLARKFRVTKTEGNFNNHVGLPRTILEATPEDEAGCLGNWHESSGRNRGPVQNCRSRRGDHHKHRRGAHRVHGFARSNRQRKRRAGRSSGIARDRDSECRRSVQ